MQEQHSADGCLASACVDIGKVVVSCDFTAHSSHLPGQHGACVALLWVDFVVPWPFQIGQRWSV